MLAQVWSIIHFKLCSLVLKAPQMMEIMFELLCYELSAWTVHLLEM